ncbi:hypothetical protein EKO04_010564 [Ascochyta lentis]|uniref:Nephrocystin 3-like N-terminal domain-containing protein n=1 Tax=Ascochyta lentis TaxID=205686 RepID=A0A8H7MFK1_9PLEO|nr:hypothetical protein EKO04_010564 [Ascochyta lentis]
MQQTPTSSRAVPRTLESMPFWNEIFPEAMAQFQEQSIEPKIVHVSDKRIRGKDSWSQVQCQLQSTRDAYLRETGLRGRVRHYRRMAADNSQVAVQTSRLLLNVDMISPVVNIVQNLVEAVHFAAKVRRDIEIGFDGLEENFCEIDFVFSTFPNDLNVRNAGINVVAAVLDTVENVIAFYLKPALKKMGSAIFQGDEYGIKVTQGLETIKARSEALVHQGLNSHVFVSRREAQGSRKRDVELMEGVRTANTNIETVENKVFEIADSVDAINKRLEMFNEAFSMLNQAEKAKLKDVEFRRERLVQGPVVLAASSPASVSYGHQLGYRPSQMTPALLWSYLDIPEIEKDDLSYFDTKYERISSVDRGRTERILGIERFKSWLVTPRSSLFLILGECESVGGVTALTLFCATLLQALREKKGTFLSLAFFCDRHREDDPYAGGIALVRSFIAQLLSQHPFNTVNVHHNVDLERVRKHKGTELCNLLSWLVRQLPDNVTLLCVIDGLGYYERSMMVEEAFNAVACISRMMHEPGLRATVKVLTTSPVPVRTMRQFFPEESILNLSTLSSFDSPSRLRTQRQLQDSLR